MFVDCRHYLRLPKIPSGAFELDLLLDWRHDRIGLSIPFGPIDNAFAPLARDPLDRSVPGSSLTLDGNPLRHLTLDTSRGYQPSRLPRHNVREVSCIGR